MLNHSFEILFLLIVGHALADYPLQGDFLAKGKNHRNPINGIPWGWCLTFHSFIHAGFVALITNSLTLGLAELLVHWMIDYLKCDDLIDFNQDQLLHIGTKLLWAGLVFVGI